MLADQRQTNEASHPDRANHLPAHPASFVRTIRTLGSPQSLLRGSLMGAQVISGRFLRRNLVVLAPQSKCFFSHLGCGGFMANGLANGLAQGLAQGLAKAA
jgi:hypothetical protein